MVAAAGCGEQQPLAATPVPPAAAPARPRRRRGRRRPGAGAASLLLAVLFTLHYIPLPSAALTTAQGDVDSLLAFKAAAVDVGPCQTTLTPLSGVHPSLTCRSAVHRPNCICAASVWALQTLLSPCQYQEPLPVSFDSVCDRCLQPDGVLDTWVNGTDPCGSGWFGVSCNCTDLGTFLQNVRADVGSREVDSGHRWF